MAEFALCLFGGFCVHVSSRAVGRAIVWVVHGCGWYMD